jgi:hypothetical protein
MDGGDPWLEPFVSKLAKNAQVKNFREIRKMSPQNTNVAT